MTKQFLASAFCALGGIYCLCYFMFGLMKKKTPVNNGMKVIWFSKEDETVAYWTNMAKFLAIGLFFLVMGVGFGLHE